MARSEAGRRGEGIRSDCWIAVETAADGGIVLKGTSKVETMYGASVRRIIEDGLKLFGIAHARVEYQDLGALPFTIMARLEAAVRRMDRQVSTE